MDNSLPLAMEGAFIESISRLANSITSYSRKIAEEAGIPYLIECERDGNKRPDHSFDIPKALERLGERHIIEMYFHVPQLCLVLVTKDEKIGIPSVCIYESGFFREQLLNRLKQ